ncbi:MAG TPA: carboxypeptidase-like regulatory domain-containing protein [Thermoanaerobaculia bacterium]|nr:carboxypeptidase-like regulatory domain-containing protein [Thermoanaerobaculia bacterium]
MRRLLASLALLLVFTACKQGSPTEPRIELSATLRGTVINAETGAPIAGARVAARMVVVKGEAYFVEGLTDASGNYALTTVSGMYILQVFAPGATSPSHVQQISIGFTQAADFRISLIGCVTMTGRVIDGSNVRLGISGATIDFAGQHVVTAADGSFRFELGCPPATDRANMILEHPSYQRREFVASIPRYSTTTEIVLEPR